MIVKWFFVMNLKPTCSATYLTGAVNFKPMLSKRLPVVRSRHARRDFPLESVLDMMVEAKNVVVNGHRDLRYIYYRWSRPKLKLGDGLDLTHFCAVVFYF